MDVRHGEVLEVLFKLEAAWLGLGRCLAMSPGLYPILRRGSMWELALFGGEMHAKKREQRSCDDDREDGPWRGQLIVL
jgi:hypothetical protein